MQQLPVTATDSLLDLSTYIINRPLVISTDVAELNNSLELHCKCTGSQMSKARYTRDTIAGSVYTPCSMYPRPGMTSWCRTAQSRGIIDDTAGLSCM